MHDVVVANGRYFGGGMMITPEAAPDDGVFDVLLIGDLTKRDLMLTLPKTYRGKHLPHPKAEVLRGAVVTVDADEPLPIELDGEQPGTTPARFEVLPRALRVRVPRGNPSSVASPLPDSGARRRSAAQPPARASRLRPKHVLIGAAAPPRPARAASRALRPRCGTECELEATCVAREAVSGSTVQRCRGGDVGGTPGRPTVSPPAFRSGLLALDDVRRRAVVVFFSSAVSRCSSFSIRFSSTSMPRILRCISSTRSRS